ncbi:hypothetical protein [Myxococcus sp. AB036A]|uniref:hypothetical protein n=1 Tax=Myxococcus sp. AB036A TaxID=2562793 RepID=UPI0011478A0B|nr:hypothetical protein [Myxococcus sp. AB036A]
MKHPGPEVAGNGCLRPFVCQASPRDRQRSRGVHAHALEREALELRWRQRKSGAATELVA